MRFPECVYLLHFPLSAVILKDLDLSEKIPDFKNRHGINTYIIDAYTSYAIRRTWLNKLESKIHVHVIIINLYVFI